MRSGKYPFPTTSESGMIESVFTVLGWITMEQIREMGLDPMEFAEILSSSTLNVRR